MNPLTVPNLIAWLQVHPYPDQEYDFNPCDACLIAEYLLGIGHINVNVGGYTVDYDDVVDAPIPRSLSDIAITHPHTYRDALTRALEYAAP